jgi:hypothetical protein
MDIQQALARVVEGQRPRARGDGRGDAADHVRRRHRCADRRLLVALRMKGETIDEIAGAAA